MADLKKLFLNKLEGKLLRLKKMVIIVEKRHYIRSFLIIGLNINKNGNSERDIIYLFKDNFYLYAYLVI